MVEFACQRCGACCRVPGPVRLRPGELECIADFLGLQPEAVAAQYTRLTADRAGLSLTEQAHSTTCIFLETDNRCRLQSVKPAQCRDFPVRWNYPGWEQRCAACATAGAR